MSAGIEYNAWVLNQQGSPALYSAILANRPAAGFTGRIFISTDTREIYRDTGVIWELIGSGGGSVNIYNSDGTLTAARTVTQNNNTLNFLGGYVNFGLHNSATNSKTLFVNEYASLGTIGNGAFGAVGTNWYLDANLPKRVKTDQSSVLEFNSGGFVFLTGGSGPANATISFTNRASILNNGRLLFGTTVDAGFLADINGTLRVATDIFAGTNVTGGVTVGATSGSGSFYVRGFTGSLNPGIQKVAANNTPIEFFQRGQTTNAYTFRYSVTEGATRPMSVGLGNFVDIIQVAAGFGLPNADNINGNILGLKPTYDQTGSIRTGTILRGIYYHPTLTDLTGVNLHYAFESTSGRLEILNAETPINTYPSAAARFLNTHNIPAASSFSGGLYFTASASVATSNFAGSTTFGIANVWAAAYSQNLFQFQAAGSTVTVNQVQKRAISAHAVFNQFGGDNSGTITDLASLQILGFYNNNTGVITPVITNAIQLLINNLNDYSHTFTLSNRWGIWQDGGSDNNYFAGKVLIGTTTVTARPIHIAGDLEFTTTLSGSAGGSSGQHLVIYANGNQYKIKLENP
jgi:hypothetical protein